MCCSIDIGPPTFVGFFWVNPTRVPTTCTDAPNSVGIHICSRHLPPQGKNPVEKRLVVVTGSEAELYIDEIDAEFMHTVGGQEDGSGGVVAQVGLTGAKGTEIRQVSQ